MYNFQEAIVVKLRLKNTALKVQKRKLLQQLRQACIRLIPTCCWYVSFYRAITCMQCRPFWLSVCQTRAFWQNERSMCPHSYTTWNTIRPRDKKNGWCEDPFYHVDVNRWPRYQMA